MDSNQSGSSRMHGLSEQLRVANLAVTREPVGARGTEQAGEILYDTQDLPGAWGQGSNPEYNSLEGKIFQSQCAIPDISDDTTIIAVCGAAEDFTKDDDGNDLPGTASPQMDGWFWSDLFLFKHFFKGHGKRQTWMGSCDPTYMVEKYGRYCQGQPGGTSDRKIVMDKDLLPEAANIIVTTPHDLLDRFLGELKIAYRAAQQDTNGHLLILAFGHGDEGTSGIQLGFYEHILEEFPPELKPQHMRDIIFDCGEPRIPVTFMTNACFAGYWAITPDLNITTLLASDLYLESNTHPKVDGTGSISGSHFVTALTRTLAEMEVEGFSSKLDLRPSSPVGSTFAGLARAVTDAIRDVEHTALIQNVLSFSSQDDEWEMFYGKRTGIPLSAFAARWNKLKPAPGHVAGLWIEHRTGSVGGRRFTLRQTKARRTKKAVKYLASKPGSDNKPSNTYLHNRLKAWLQDNVNLTESELMMIERSIDYRRNVVKVCAIWLHELDIKFQDCDKIDVETYTYSTPNARAVYGSIRAQLSTWPMFTKPRDGEGRYWPKGSDYLAIAMAEAGWDVEKVKTMLAPRFKNRDPNAPWNTGVPKVKGVNMMIDTITVQQLNKYPSVRGELEKLASSLKTKLRPSSPKKVPHQRGSILPQYND